MPIQPLSLLLGKSSFKVRNKTRGIDVMAKVKVLRTKIMLSSTAMRHMREDGTTIVDTRVIMPFALEVEIICPDLNVASDALSTLQDRASLYTVTSKGLVFDNVMMMHDAMQQTPENLSSTPTRIFFQEVLLQGGQQSITAQPADSSVLDRGIATIRDAAQSATGAVTQTVADLFNRATESVGRAVGQ